jgi:hypothetical protein
MKAHLLVILRKQGDRYDHIRNVFGTCLSLPQLLPCHKDDPTTPHLTDSMFFVSNGIVIRDAGAFAVSSAAQLGSVIDTVINQISHLRVTVTR